MRAAGKRGGNRLAHMLVSGDYLIEIAHEDVTGQLTQRLFKIGIPAIGPSDLQRTESCRPTARTHARRQYERFGTQGPSAI